MFPTRTTSDNVALRYLGGKHQLVNQATDLLANEVAKLTAAAFRHGVVDAAHNVSPKTCLGVKRRPHSQHPARGEVKQLGHQRGGSQVNRHAQAGDAALKAKGVSSTRMAASHWRSSITRSLSSVHWQESRQPSAISWGLNRSLCASLTEASPSSTCTRHPRHRPCPPQGNSTPWAKSRSRKAVPAGAVSSV